MDVMITGIKLRAIDTKLCDFLSETGAWIAIDPVDKRLDVCIELKANGCVEFLSDERDEIIIRLVKNGKKLSYTFASIDVDSVTFQ